MSSHTAAANHKAPCKISVLMSVFNGERYLDQAVDSILSQTFSDFEFIIIDDGSTDNTTEILASYDDPRIRIVRQENSGIVKSLNRGLLLARGEYVARMDADDLSFPQRFAAQVEELDSCDQIDLVACFYEVIDSCNRVLKVERLQTDPLYRLWRLQFHNIWAHGSVMVRRSRLVNVGGYTDSFPCEDYDLWLRLSHASNTKIIPSVLYSFRVSEGLSQISTQHRDTQAALGIAISNHALAACNPTRTDSDFQEVRSLYLGRTASCFTQKGFTLIPETVNGFSTKYGISPHEKWKLTAQVVRDALYVLLASKSVPTSFERARLTCKLFAHFPFHLVYAILQVTPRLLRRIVRFRGPFFERTNSGAGGIFGLEKGAGHHQPSCNEHEPR
jgi:glycosyltransferase involved in cell wall biosynthesis